MYESVSKYQAREFAKSLPNYSKSDEKKQGWIYPITITSDGKFVEVSKSGFKLPKPIFNLLWDRLVVKGVFHSGIKDIELDDSVLKGKFNVRSGGGHQAIITMSPEDVEKL